MRKLVLGGFHAKTQRRKARTLSLMDFQDAGRAIQFANVAI